MTKANWTLEMLENSWMSKRDQNRAVFISAANRQNIERLREMMYQEVSRLHAVRYPYNNFLY
jgi:GTP-binding protein HflX